MHVRFRVWPWLIEFSAVALSCFTLSRLTVFANASLIKPEVWFSSLFMLECFIQCYWSGHLGIASVTESSPFCSAILMSEVEHCPLHLMDFLALSELGRCVKVEVAVLGSRP